MAVSSAAAVVRLREMEAMGLLWKTLVVVDVVGWRVCWKTEAMFDILRVAGLRPIRRAERRVERRAVRAVRSIV